MEIALIIPAKGKSERVKNKNLYEINGKSLVRMACEKALKCKNVNRVYLDTEDEGIVLNCRELINEGLNIIDRPPELATNFTGANELMIFGIHSIDYCDLLLETFATSPLIKAETIDNCINKFLDDRKNQDSFFTVTKIKEYFWKNNSPFNFDPDVLPNSVDLDPLYMETHGLYGIMTESLLRNKMRVGNHPMLIEIPLIESIDIDTHEDLELAERILVKNKIEII